jgi:HK97 family phage major capsid protein
MPTMQDDPAIVEKRERLGAKQKELVEVVQLLGPDRDFGQKSVIDKLGATSADDAILKFRAWNKEANELGEELKQATVRREIAEIERRQDELTRPAPGTGITHYGKDGQRKSWARLYVESKEYAHSLATKGRVGIALEIDVGAQEAFGIGTKTLMTTTAGFGPEAVRSGVLVEKATRPIQVTDLIPTFPISQNAFVYMEVSTRTHAAIEVAEGTAYPESVFVWTQRSSKVEKVGDSIPVTDEQLEDADQVQSLLESRLSFGVRQRLDSQILVGNGTTPNLRGINAVVGIQVHAKGGDNGVVAFAKAMNLVRTVGRAIPTGAVLHPNDWLDIWLLPTATGDFLFGNPFQGAGPTSIFGVSVAQSDAQTEHTGLVGDFNNFSRLDNKRGVIVQTGYVGSQFTEGEVTLRADLRAAFTVTRPAAFVQVTGL